MRTTISLHTILRTFIVILLGTVLIAHAATGTIDPTNAGSYKALIPNASLGSATSINFGKFTTQSAKNITVSDSELRGFAWGEGVGWIVMNCADTTSGCSSTNGSFKVANDGNGNLSGYAWGENTGWVNFGPFTNPLISTVKITSGQFAGTLGAAGYAWTQNFGYITFDCSSGASCVTTDWAPASGGSFQCNDGIDNDNDGAIDYPADSGCSSPTDNTESNGGGGGGTLATCSDGIQNQNETGVDTGGECGNPPPNVCADPSASNLGGALPCIYPNNPTLCTDATALNFGNPLPCSYPINPTNPTTCTDPTANNTGSVLPCTYTISPQVTCADASATNFGNPLPCTYPSALTFCEQYPSDCVPPNGPGTPEVIGEATVSVATSSIGKMVALIGLAAIPIASATTYLITNPFSIYDIGLLLARLWSMLLIFFGLKKKSNPWGTVYDSITKQPIDPAYVVLYDMTGKEIATSITDIEGRYGFAVPAGTYTILANKTNFVFPSTKLGGKTEDELYRDLYFGGPITVTEEGGIIAKNIPMDQLNFDWNEYAKDQQHRLRHYKRQDVLIARISNIVFIIGFIITGVAVAVSPTLFNMVMMGLYLVFAIAQIFGWHIRPKGSVVDSATNHALPFSIVRVLSNATNKEVLHRVADAKGDYYALIANGDYHVTVDRKNADQSYTANYIPDAIKVRKGYLKEHFKI